MSVDVQIENFHKRLCNAFQEDLEKLLYEYEQLQNLDIESFAKIWKEMDFSLIYSGQTSAPQIKLFTEMCFKTTWKYFIKSDSVYYKAGSLYALYVLYYKQPLANWIKIRISYDSMLELQEFVSEMKTKNQESIPYVYAKLRTDNAFEYVIKEAYSAPEMKFHRRFDVAPGHRHKDSVSKVTQTLKSLCESKELQELAVIDNEYQTLMKKFTEEHPDTPVISFGSNIAKEFTDIYQEQTVEARKERRESIRQIRRTIRRKAQRTINKTYKMQKLADAASRKIKKVAPQTSSKAETVTK